MKKRMMSLDGFVDAVGSHSLVHLMSDYGLRFEKRFGFEMHDQVEVELLFENVYDAQDFYLEVKHNKDYASQYKVRTCMKDSKVIFVSGAKTLFDYFGTKEPNLLTISRNHECNFKINYVQQYSGTLFTGEVIQGELLGRHCLVEVSTLIPELSLAGLKFIASTRKEFESLLTRVSCVESVVIYE